MRRRPHHLAALATVLLLAATCDFGGYMGLTFLRPPAAVIEATLISSARTPDNLIADRQVTVQVHDVLWLATPDSDPPAKLAHELLDNPDNDRVELPINGLVDLQEGERYWLWIRQIDFSTADTPDRRSLVITFATTDTGGYVPSTDNDELVEPQLARVHQLAEANDVPVWQLLIDLAYEQEVPNPGGQVTAPGPIAEYVFTDCWLTAAECEATRPTPP